VHANWQITINEAVNELGISNGSAQARLTEELQMIRDEVRWNPAPQQHSKSHDNSSAADLGRKTSCTHTAATVFTRPHTL